MMLFFKECKKIIFSLTFLIYLFAVIGFYFTQFVPDSNEQISPPSQNIQNYGTIVKETPEVLMPSATDSLITEYLRGYYVAYPFTFYKEVKLKEKESAEIAAIITEITGISKKELDGFSEFTDAEYTMMPDEMGGYVPVQQEAIFPEIHISDTMNYEHFRELMRKTDKIIGGDSKYSDNNILDNFSIVPRTYEDALEDYNAIIEKDKITGAYARLFCDYMGIIVSILPVFVLTSFINYDKKSRMEQLIYVRKISSTKLVFTRFLSAAVVLMIPVIILSVVATVQLKSIYSSNDIDLLAITRMAIYWLVPNILFSTALGMILTECSSPLIAVFFGGAIWIASLMDIAKGLKGNIGLFTLICRHNSLYDRYLFMEDLDKFVFNRIFYTVLAILLVLLTTYIYNLKRKGDFYAIRKHSFTRKNKSKA